MAAPAGGGEQGQLFRRHRTPSSGSARWLRYWPGVELRTAAQRPGHHPGHMWTLSASGLSMMIDPWLLAQPGHGGRSRVTERAEQRRPRCTY